MSSHRWKVIKRDNQWRLLDRGIWFDTFPTLKQAHTYATQCAIADKLFTEHGLTDLAELLAGNHA